MELRITDDNGKLPTLERPVRKPKVIRVEPE
jgi:hypothetical protein